VARHEVIEQHAQRGEVLLYRWRRIDILQPLDVSSDVEGAYLLQFQAALVAPVGDPIRDCAESAGTRSSDAERILATEASAA